MTKLVEINVQDAVGYLKLNRPEKLNALSWELVQEVMDALDDLSADQTVKVIVLSGEGKAFSAGGDISSMRELADAAEVAEWIEYVSGLPKKIMDLNKYVIAAVHGYAAGAGFSIALAADFIVADEDAKFALSFSNIGLIPDLGLIKLLTERVSPPIAKEWISSAKTLSAEEARSHGLINKISTGSVVEAAAEFADFIVKGPPISNKYVKYLVNHTGDLHKETAFMQENMIQAMLLQTKDHQEGVAAFFGKRIPQFNGN
ncbi:2-(1,2-epoxy-1,2-dihydrophenyl)acetyl-CoA isomerase [Planomicrobium stackebrandtii]|uniref:2-(1,2-epoxy-1,2-dihydrophenyl)acetyl-CoA isomerase n=1 Tax=Planomicrobium stackebrandtii TaxID=253160 RepID=A0ABU0GRW2_9BACL|nr:enoyl-CoA hydratase/isomerase family protein [Planomicrobium stackebrandtii]MDQ0428101.1 2-(1,2-epoxy-1,2-dihydrophenyl)acetyl-CoA isomerase [Planomicrobium stackebrandtii]